MEGSNLPADKLLDLQRVVAGSCGAVGHTGDGEPPSPRRREIPERGGSLSTAAYAEQRPGGEMVLASFFARNGQAEASLELINDKWAASDSDLRGPGPISHRH